MGVEPAIPRYQDLLWPTLEVLRGETQPLGFGSILEKLTDTQHSTAEQRAAHQAGERATEFVREDEIGTFRAAYIVLGRRKRLNFAVLASWAGVGVAVLAAGAALLQADVTKDQNREAQRESLITVVGEIAPDVAARQTAKGESEHTLAQALTAYAAQGAELINELPAGSTPPIDGYEVGLAFENVDDYADALKWFDRASAARPRELPHVRPRGRSGNPFRIGRQPKRDGSSSRGPTRNSAVDHGSGCASFPVGIRNGVGGAGRFEGCRAS